MRRILLPFLLLALCPSSFAGLVPDGAPPEQVADGYKFTEGPALGPDGCIYFTDIPAELILKFDPASRETTTFLEQTGKANGLMWHEGNLYMCCHGTRAVRYYRPSKDSPEIDKRAVPGGFSRTTNHIGQINTILDHWSHLIDPKESRSRNLRLNSPNDIAIDKQGNFYFTDPRYGNRDDMETHIEGVYYSGTTVEKIDGRDVTMSVYKEIDKSLTRPNGIVLSPDGKLLYVADNGENWIYTYDVESQNMFGSRQKFARINDGKGGGSDGMCVDQQGRLYATGHGKVWVFEPTGQLVATIPVGRQTTNVTFGADGKTLYITANKGLYRITLNTDAPLQHAEQANHQPVAPGGSPERAAPKRSIASPKPD